MSSNVGSLRSQHLPHVATGISTQHSQRVEDDKFLFSVPEPRNYNFTDRQPVFESSTVQPPISKFHGPRRTLAGPVQGVQPALPPGPDQEERQLLAMPQVPLDCATVFGIGLAAVLSAAFAGGFMAGVGAAGAAILCQAGYLVCLPAAAAAMGALGGFVVFLPLALFILYKTFRQAPVAPSQPEKLGFKDLLKGIAKMSATVVVIALCGFAFLVPAAGVLSVSMPAALAAFGIGAGIFYAPFFFFGLYKFISGLCHRSPPT